MFYPLGRLFVALFMMALGMAWLFGMFPEVSPDVAMIIGTVWAVGGLIVLWR